MKTLAPESPSLSQDGHALRRVTRPNFGTGVAWLLRITDLLVLVSLLAAFSWWRRGDIGLVALVHPVTVVVVVAVMLGLYLADSYQLDRRQHPLQSLFRVAIGLGSAGLLIGLGLYLFGPELLRGELGPVGRTIIIPVLLTSGLVMASVRLALRRFVVASASRSLWLVVGKTDDPGIKCFEQLFAEGRGPGDLHFLSDGTTAEDSEVYYDRLEYLLTKPWSGIVIQGGWDLSDRMIERLMHARLAGVRVYDLSDFYEHCWMRLPVHHLHHGWFAFSTGFPLLHDQHSARAKRTFDVLIALSVLIITLPLMILAWVIVRLESRGPGFYSQTRVGMGGDAFTVYKFRSMRRDAESAGAKWATKNDPRVTRFGKLMRLTRIDELPQLWNVVRGDMSFIGPRPERPEFTKELEKTIPFYALRHLVRPGLTGWAQVNYSYGASVDDARAKLEFDLYYLKNHSVWLDLIILFRTVRVVLWGTGAR